MSLKGSEAVQVKVEPLCTDDEANMESEDERRHAGHIHLDIKKEPDWNVEAFLATNRCGDRVKKDHVTTSREVGHIDHEIKKETEEWSKASQDRYVDHVVKVERDIDVPDVSEVALQVNEIIHKALQTQSISKVVGTNIDIKKESNSGNISTSTTITTPTGLYIDHVVKVERESDEFTNKPCLLEKYLNHLSKESESKEDTQNMVESKAIKTGLCTDNMVKIESVTSIAGLYMNHVVKEELVVGPEVLQKPHQASNQVGNNTSYASCSVRLETMHMDTDRGMCRIGCNTYKLGPCLQSQPGSITQKDQNNQMGTKIKSLNQTSNIKDKPHKCDICDFATAYRYKLTHHKKKHSDDKPFRCLLCSYASAFKAHLQVHEKTHAKIKPFKCDKCSYTCVQKSDLQVHVRKHTGEKPYKCDYCVYACTRKRDLLTHIRTHTGEKPFKCQHCDYGCIRKRDWIVHITTHHNEDNSGQEFKVIYKCNYCSFSTPIRQSWMVHERKIHAREKPFQCKRCNYAVSCRTSYLNHIQKHTGVVKKRYKCSHCDYATNHKNHLSVHQRTHTGEKPYKCSHCAYASAHRRDLYVHEALHKGEKTYKCNRCTYGCNNLSNLRVHEKMHVGDNENKLTETLKGCL